MAIRNSNYPGRIGAEGLSVWLCLYVYIIMCVCTKTWLFTCTALLLEDCQVIALNSLVVEYLFLERCLRSRDSLLSRAMAMYSY